MKKVILALLLLAAPAFAQRPALVSPVIRFSDNSGKPLVFGKLFSYQAGTTTPMPTFVDSTTGAVNQNPVILDATGSATVFLGANVYKFVLQNASGTVQWTADNIAEGMFQSSYVNSVFGRTGTVVAVSGDYNCSQITGAVCSLPTPPTLYNQTVQVAGAPAVQEPILNFIAGVAGSVISPTVTNGGSGYTGAPTVTFTGGVCTVTPTGSATVADGAVTALIINTAGSGCATPPVVSFSGGGGTGATATVELLPAGISCVDNPGATSTDCTFNISSGGGSGGTCVLNDETSSRSIGGIYQNTTNGLMYLSGAGNTAGGGVGGLEIFEGSISPNVAVFNQSPTATVSGGGVGFFAAILPGYFYQIQSAGAVNGIQHWVEITGCGGGGTGSAGVTSVNVVSQPPITGAVAFACGTGLTCTQSGSTITIATFVPFTINSFTGCNGTLELGATVTNPTCSATYSATPASASITNTDSVDSPLVLSTPFTSGTIVGSFVHTSVTTTTITLTAIGSSTQTANQAYTWNPRIFGGVGTPGATSTVTASGTTAILSTSDALPSAGLGAETTGQIIGSYSPSGQAIYLLLTGSAHTFTDNSTGFPMAFNSPISVSFVNVNGTTVSMFLYASTNPLTGTFVPKIAS